MSVILETKFGLRGKLKVSVIERGLIVREYPTISNLILNQGLDQIAARNLVNNFIYAAAGTGSTPTELDSIAETATIVAGSVTISTTGFLAGDSSDVGKTIKMTGSGNLYLVTAAGSQTSCTVTPPNNEGPDGFIVYHTQQTGLASESTGGGGSSKRTSTVLLGAPYVQTVTAGTTTTHTRTFDFAIESAPITYNEVGFSFTSTVASNLFSRVKLPTGVPLTAGQQLRVQYSVALTVSPTTPLVFGTSPIIGWPTGTGSFQFYAIPQPYIRSSDNNALGGINPADGLYYGDQLEPGSTSPVTLILTAASTAHGSYGAQFITNDATTFTQSVANSSYVAGSYTRDKLTTFAVGSANANNFRRFGFGFWNGSGSSYTHQCSFLFDTNQQKASTFTLTLGVRTTWSRIL